MASVVMASVVMASGVIASGPTRASPYCSGQGDMKWSAFDDLWQPTQKLGLS